VVDVLKEIDPSLEFMFVNQHLNLKELKVDPQGALRKYLNYSNSNSLKTELIEFLDKFSY